MPAQLDYASLPDLINNLAATYKRVEDENPLNKQDALDWGIDCLRQIGGQVYTEIPGLVLEVWGNKVRVPHDTQLINGIYDIRHIPNNNFNDHCRLHPLQLVDGIRSNHIDECSPNIDCLYHETVSINWPYLITSFHDGKILIDYFGFKLDEHGIPMYPDEVSIAEALKAYILYKWLYEPFLIDNIKGDKFQYLEQKKNYYIQQAKNYMNMPDVLESKKMVREVDRRYRRFRIRK